MSFFLRISAIRPLLLSRASCTLKKPHQFLRKMMQSQPAAAPGVTPLEAVSQKVEDVRSIRTALISVFNKSRIVELGQFLQGFGVKIISSGKTHSILNEAGVQAQDVSSYTGSPEIFDGRVKTLHPKVHGGILYCRGNAHHELEAEKLNIQAIDLVVVDLYPFEKAVESGSFDQCIENIDIGGPCLIRAAAKNHSAVCVLSSTSQYDVLMSAMQNSKGSTSRKFRAQMAREAFRVNSLASCSPAHIQKGKSSKKTASYDAAVLQYLESSAAVEEEAETAVNGVLERSLLAKPKTSLSSSFVANFEPIIQLKYGCNPHQIPAAICTVNGGQLPFTVLNGTPGYINFLDSVYAFQLVTELKERTGLCAAASYKHCSPAGAALSRPLEAIDYQVCDIPVGKCVSSVAAAYILARNSDPLCSFGDFIGLSDEVDEDLASILKQEVSDGIIAPGYTEAALAILKEKKGGKYVILQAKKNFTPPSFELRQLCGVGFIQKKDTSVFSPDSFLEPVNRGSVSEEIAYNARLDLALASISLKYTQSNSVVYAKNCQLIGVGAGQQSRVDCVKLAGKKAANWHYRHHQKIIGLPFRAGVKRQDRVNTRIYAIEGDLGLSAAEEFMNKLDEKTESYKECVLTAEEKAAFLLTLCGVSMASDAFFPFRDSIDEAFKYGVKYVAHPGGSVQDGNVTDAANSYSMHLFQTGIRAFLH